jgi:hypothetical protein
MRLVLAQLVGLADIACRVLLHTVALVPHDTLCSWLLVPLVAPLTFVMQYFLLFFSSTH